MITMKTSMLSGSTNKLFTSMTASLLLLLLSCQLQPALAHINSPGTDASSPLSFQHQHQHQVIVHRTSTTLVLNPLHSTVPNVGTSSRDDAVLDSDRTAVSNTATTASTATTATTQAITPPAATAATTRDRRQLRGEQRKIKAMSNSLSPTATPTPKSMKKSKKIEEHPTPAPSRSPVVSVPTFAPSSRPVTTPTREPTSPSPSLPTQRPIDITTNTTETPTNMPTDIPDTNMRDVPISFSMLVATHNIFDTVNQLALIRTMEDYLTAGMMRAYPNSASVRVILEASSSAGESNSIDYSGLVVLITTAAPSAGVVQALAQVLLLDMAAVQTAVDNNPDVTPSENPTARVEEIIVGNMSVVALSSFTMVLVAPDVVDQVQLTVTLEQYLAAGMVEKYPNAVEVMLSGTASNSNIGDDQSSTAVDYTGHVIFSKATAPSFRDVQAWQQELLLNLTAVQDAVDGNPAIGQDTSVDQVAVDGSGGQVGESTSAVALPDFTIVVNTRNGTDPVNQAELTITLQDYLKAGITEVYPSVVAVTLNGTPNQVNPINAIDYTGYVVFSSTAPPAEDVQALAQELLLDLTAVQAAVDGNPAIGQDAQAEQVDIGGIGSQVIQSKSAVALLDFTIVVNTTFNNGGLNQAELTVTLQDYLAAGIVEEYPNVAAVILNGTPNQEDPTNAVDYTGHVEFSGTAPPAEDVQAFAQELLLDLVAVQAAVDGNPFIGQDALVEQVTFEGSGGEVGPSTRTLALPDFTLVVTSDDTDTVDESQLSKTLEDYLMAGIMQDFPSAVAVALGGSQTQIDDTNVFDKNGFVVFFDKAPPSAQDVESLVRDLMFDLTNVQAAVDTNSGIGKNVRVEEVIVGDDSVVALSDFTIVIQSDDIDAVNQAELTRTLEDYLVTGLMQDFPGVEAVVLQPRQMQRSDTIFFSGYAMFVGSAPDFRDVQSRGRGVLRDTSALQAALDSNPAIGDNVRVSSVVFGGSVGDDNDDINTAAIIGGAVGAVLLTLILAAILITRRRNIPESHDDDDDNEGTPLASRPPPLPTVVASYS